MLQRVIARFPQGSIRRNALQILFLQVGGISIGLIASIIVGRTLGPEGKGVVDVFRLLTSLLAELGLFGMTTGLLYHFANQGRPLAQVHGTGLIYAVVAGVITLALGALAIDAWRGLFPGLEDPLIVLAFGLSGFFYYRSIWAGITLGTDRPARAQQLSFLAAALNLAGTGYLALTGRMTTAALIGMAAATTVIPALIGLALMIRRERRVAPSVELARLSIRQGSVAWIGAVANLINFRVDQVLISALLDTRAIGLYAVSVRFAELIFVLDGPIIQAALKRVSALPAAESYALTRRLFVNQIRLSGGAALGLAVIAYPVIVLLYGPAFEDAVLPLILLVPGIAAWSCARVLANYIVYNRGLVWIPTLFSLIGMAVNIALNLILLPRIGINGAAIASSLSYTVVIILVLIAHRRLRPVTIVEG
jgi:O-antigen/teichoic acid export membrane protein